MLKSFYFILAFILSLPVIAQKNFVQDNKLNGVIPLDADGKPAYQLTKSVDNATKEELFKRARKWFAKSYNSSKDVLQLNDPATGELVGKGSFPVKAKILRVNWNHDVNHTLSVELKDNKYRITLTDLRLGNTPLKDYKLPYIATSQGQYTIVYEAIDAQCHELIASLEKALNTKDDF